MPQTYQRFAERRFALISAPNGARRMPSDHAAIPLTAGQIGDCAKSLLDQSVAVLHLHVRDNELRHSLDASLYRDAGAAVRKAVGDQLIVQVTTEAAGIFEPDEQMAVVRELRPEAVSLALRELCPDADAETAAGKFFEWLVRESVWPQYILYSVEDVRRFDALRRKGLFADDHPFVMLVLGQYAQGKAGTLAELDDMLAAAGEFPWCVCCFGAGENAAALHAVGLGGHVRLGFENNVCLLDGSIAGDNAALIAQFHATRPKNGRTAATADEIREQWLA